jgi:hypothetical protein
VSLFKMPWQWGQRGARDALDAADERRVAVDLEQPVAARQAMQVVDVLRDRALEDAELLELDERVVARVRARRRQRLPELPHRAGRIQALLPGASRITQEALIAIERRLAVLRPEPAGSAERWDPALDGEPGAGERDRIARTSKALGRLVEDVQLPRFHRRRRRLSRRA